MKYHLRPEFTEVNAIKFDAPEAMTNLSEDEVRFIEKKFNVRRISETEGHGQYSVKWVFARISDTARSPIHPGDFIVTGPDGYIDIVPGFTFLARYEPVED